MAQAKKNVFLEKFYAFMASVWLFPVIGIITLILLTGFEISGSSVSIYYKNLYGSTAQDPGLLFGSPRSIRSDEWEVQTAQTAAQAKAGFPRTNKNIGDGQNMEAIVDTPYKNWTTVFKPQNLGFLVLPFANAFAFKWWFLSLMLVLGCYFFILTLLPKKRLLAALASLCLLFSPFIQWWYQTITLAPIFYSFFIAIAAIQVWRAKTRNTRIAWALGLSYAIVGFFVVLYPPFQIPCALVMTVFLLGYFIEQGYLTNSKILMPGLRSSLVALVIASACIAGFISSGYTAINAARNSLYPGKRVGTSGHFESQFLLANFLDSQLQLTHKARNYVANQSEASNFILLSPILSVAVLFILAQERRRKKSTDWPLLMTTLLFLLFMVRLFVPGTDILFKPLLMEPVPNARLLIGIGLVSFVQLILVVRHLIKSPKVMSVSLAFLLGIAALVVNISVALDVRREYPGYVHNLPLIITLATIPAIVITLFLLRRFYAGFILFLVFSLGSSALVNPIYRGTGPLIGSELSQEITAVGKTDPESKWAVADDLTLENMPAMSNVPSVVNVYTYPQSAPWTKSAETAKQSDIYNRYAHTLATLKPQPVHLVLKQPDFFEIVGSPCDAFYKQQNVRYFLTQKDYSQDFSCLKVRKVVDYPNTHYYILEIQ